MRVVALGGMAHTGEYLRAAEHSAPTASRGMQTSFTSQVSGLQRNHPSVDAHVSLLGTFLCNIAFMQLLSFEAFWCIIALYI